MAEILSRTTEPSASDIAFMEDTYEWKKDSVSGEGRWERNPSGGRILIEIFHELLTAEWLIKLNNPDFGKEEPTTSSP